MEFVYSDPSVIKEQLVLQHSDEQYLFLQSIWYPQWGKTGVSRDQSRNSLHLPLHFRLYSSYSSEELSIGPVKSGPVRAGGTWRDMWKALNSLQQAAVMAPKDLA